MKKKKINKKLSLNKETIAKFNLSNIKGGGPTDETATWNEECRTFNCDIFDTREEPNSITCNG